VSAHWIIGIAVLVGVFFVGVTASVLTGLVTTEVRGWIPYLSRALVRRAARHLPPEMAERVEEYEAEICEYEDRPLSMLLTGLRIWRDGRAIGREAQPLAVGRATTTDDDLEGARLISLNMALNGESRQKTAVYIQENFSLNDPESMLDEVYEAVDGGPPDHQP
jgi:hypothetical protein